ncbi:MAG: hypothetical protein ABIH46_06290 [Chloroflexota bacterium]
MTVRLIPRVTATVINPDTPLPYQYTAGEAISAKAPVAKSETDSRIYEADATTWDRMPAFGIAREAKNPGEVIEVLQFGIATGVERTEDFDYDDRIFVSETQGKLTKTPPNTIGSIVQTMGRALSSSDLILEIDQSVIQINKT